MSLLLADNCDQALLTMVIQEARQVADQADTYLGRTALQKILYFLKATGVPMSYRFEIYHYGPYCAEVLRDAEWLQADSVIRDDSGNNPKYSNYHLGDAAEELLEVFRNEIEIYRARVREVVQALVPMRPERLELIATLDYLHRWFAASGKPGPWKEQVVTRFLKLKGDRFTRSDVEQAYDTMLTAELIKPN